MISRKLTQAIALDFERMVEAGTKVLEYDHRGQLYDLLRVERALQRIKDGIGNVDWRARHLLSVSQGCLVTFCEMAAALECAKFRELLFGESFLSADGRVDVDSERTANHLGGAKAD